MDGVFWVAGSALMVVLLGDSIDVSVAILGLDRVALGLLILVWCGVDLSHDTGVHYIWSSQWEAC